MKKLIPLFSLLFPALSLAVVWELKDGMDIKKLREYEIPRRTFPHSLKTVWKALRKATYDLEYEGLNMAKRNLSTRWIDVTKKADWKMFQDQRPEKVKIIVAMAPRKDNRHTEVAIYVRRKFYVEKDQKWESLPETLSQEKMTPLIFTRLSRHLKSERPNL